MKNKTLLVLLNFCVCWLCMFGEVRFHPMQFTPEEGNWAPQCSWRRTYGQCSDFAHKRNYWATPKGWMQSRPLRVRSENQQPQHQLGVHQKCKFSAPPPNYWFKTWGQDCVWTSPLCDSVLSLNSTDHSTTQLKIWPWVDILKAGTWKLTGFLFLSEPSYWKDSNCVLRYLILMDHMAACLLRSSFFLIYFFFVVKYAT